MADTGCKSLETYSASAINPEGFTGKIASTATFVVKRLRGCGEPASIPLDIDVTRLSRKLLEALCLATSALAEAYAATNPKEKELLDRRSSGRPG